MKVTVYLRSAIDPALNRSWFASRKIDKAIALKDTHKHLTGTDTQVSHSETHTSISLKKACRQVDSNFASTETDGVKIHTWINLMVAVKVRM
jgi:hypothetical protein